MGTAHDSANSAKPTEIYGRPGMFYNMALQLFYVFILFSLCCLVYSSKKHSIVEKVVYKYPNQVEGDWELPECGNYSVCSVIRLKYWQPPDIHRVCRCNMGTECPWRWANASDPYHMPLDNRSQLKFCQKINKLPRCLFTQSAMVVSKDDNGDKTEALCECKWPAYWQLQRFHYHDFNNGSIINNRYFRCAQLFKCQVNEFCGHVTGETFSTYYRCSCPVGTLCLNKDRIAQNVTELLHFGPLYRGHCVPVETLVP